MSLDEKLAARFWSKVQKSSDDECWPWKAGLDACGYGRIQIRGASTLAHRVSFISTKGPIPPGAVILHSCDNPKCCNPSHLSAGTQKQNVQEAYDRGRQPKKKKGTEEAISMARRLRKEGKTYAAIAKTLNVTKASIQNWIGHENIQKSWSPNLDTIARMVEMRKMGASIRKIALLCDYSEITVSKYLRRANGQ
jgi:DNA-binding CsgD family transcriptional regulator